MCDDDSKAKPLQGRARGDEVIGALERVHIPIFTILRTLMHVLDEQSPLNGFDAAKAVEMDARVFVTVEVPDLTLTFPRPFEGKNTVAAAGTRRRPDKSGRALLCSGRRSGLSILLVSLILSLANTGEPPRIVASGAPLRGIAPCGACHGEVDSKASAAWLEGQPAIYLRTQLEAVATGARHNDIGEQMRNIARGMTAAEIGAASRFYADRP